MKAPFPQGNTCPRLRVLLSGSLNVPAIDGVETKDASATLSFCPLPFTFFSLGQFVSFCTQLRLRDLVLVLRRLNPVLKRME